ncbi:Sec8 exocyst complex component-specific domain-containing protein [Phanerochaete sordida]|uniref:Exocyst complex component Sec8 n=1 Tax=Phanerochaete sordida TaxID=48140 RepID=A0A9P3G4V2_9APHY|nr:Sec8 exocyst complex component-specific domain-containing protein [Phanerochaete sordida]
MPVRPARSGLRGRNTSELSGSERLSLDTLNGDYRDSTGTTRSDASQPPPRPPRAGVSTSPPNAQIQTSNLLSPLTPSSAGTELSPSEAAALAMFQHAMAKRRGMTEEDVADVEYRREKEREAAIQMDRQRRIRAKVPGMRAHKPRAGDIDAVLNEIKDEWEIATNPDFNPVDLALQLIDDSGELAQGKDMTSFRQTKDMLSRALKGSVDKHYQAFNASLSHHAALLNHLSGIQGQLSEARSALQEAKDGLGNKRGDLVQLWSRNQTLEEMLRILDQIDHLRSVPDALESLISEKRLLQASVLLVRSLKLIHKPDMMDIGALSDLRSYLNTQETALREILVDELHSHLYLRSFWCESRWAVYEPGQQTLQKVEFEEDSAPVDPLKASVPSTPITPTSRSTRLDRYLDDLNLRPNEAPFDLSEQNHLDGSSGTVLQASASMSLGLLSNQSRTSLAASLTAPSLALAASQSAAQSNRNPEAESFSYMETLLEALAVLGKLGLALDIVAQKLPQEIYALVDTTLEEVAERAEYGRRASTLGPSSATSVGRPGDVYFSTNTGLSGLSYSPAYIGARSSGHGQLLPARSLRLAALEMSTKRTDQEIMKDLFWTMYSKLDAVAQGLRVIYEVSNRIGSRRDFKDTSGTKPGSLFPLAEIWSPIQAEVRTLLNDYITDEEQGVVSGRNPISSINEVLREGKHHRDRGKPVFRFADADLKLVNKYLKAHEDELTRVLKDSVPGLVQGSTENAVQATLSAVGQDDRLLGSGHHHRLLVHPDAFHVSVLFQPTLAFMDRIAEVLPEGREAVRASGNVLDEFVMKVYLPQLEDKVSELFHQAVTSSDAFQPDSVSTSLSPKPLMKAAVQLMALINSLCSMLRTTPFHRESYSRLILTVIVQFYQRCSDKFQDLVSIKEDEESEALPRLSLAAQWAQRSEFVPCLGELFNAIEDPNATTKKIQLCRQHTHLEGSLLNDRTVGKDELVRTTRDLATLTTLYHSVTWFTTELGNLKSAPEGSLSPTSPQKLEPLSAVSPYTPYGPAIAVQSDEQLQLPLSHAMAMRFQALQKTYEQLSETILHTVRVDIRCRVWHHLDLALRSGNYYIDQEVSEPDPHIVDLNADLVKCDDYTSSTLPTKERRFVFEGIGQLMESLLISNAKHIRAMNQNGVKKMFRNILALQQNTKIISEGLQVDFDRAKRYYILFTKSPSDLLDAIRAKQEFSFDEYKTVLDLLCGVDPTQGESAAAHAADRNYGMYVIELHGLELENSADQ